MLCSQDDWETSSSDNEITQKRRHKHSVNGEVLNNCWYCDFFLKTPILWKTHVLWVVNLAKEECKESRSPAILPMFHYGRPSIIFHSVVGHLSHTYSPLPVSCHVKDKNYSRWESKTDTTLSVWDPCYHGYRTGYHTLPTRHTRSNDIAVASFPEQRDVEKSRSTIVPRRQSWKFFQRIIFPVKLRKILFWGFPAGVDMSWIDSLGTFLTYQLEATDHLGQHILHNTPSSNPFPSLNPSQGTPGPRASFQTFVCLFSVYFFQWFLLPFRETVKQKSHQDKRLFILWLTNGFWPFFCSSLCCERRGAGAISFPVRFCCTLNS